MAYVAVVTGVSGFIGSELCKQLLLKGWEVRGTVRSLAKAEKVEHLRALGDALPGKLTLHEADLLVDGSFDEVVKGADYVFHTASPFFMKAEDPKKDLLDPAVKGTTTVIKSAIKSKDSIKRVVLTSSVAAIMKTKKGPGNGKLYTDEDWNDEATLTEGSYPFSKTEAEKAARKLAAEEGLDLITIHPSFVLGPVLSQRTDATSVSTFKELLEGADISMTGRQVDVRDIAEAHIRAVEVPGAHGRYIVSQSGLYSTKFTAEVLSRRFPQFRFTASKDAGSMGGFDTTKIHKELGMTLTPIEQTYIDMATTMIQLGIAKPVAK